MKKYGLCLNVNHACVFRLELNQEQATTDGSNTNIRLLFQNGLKQPIYTYENVTSWNNAPIKLGISTILASLIVSFFFQFL